MSRTEFWIGLLASSLSIVIGVIVAFLTHEFVVGLLCAVVVYAVLLFAAEVFVGESHGKTISEKPSRNEAQVRRDIPQQQSNLRGDATEPTERQTAPDGVAVRKEPEKPNEALAECDRKTMPSGAQSMLTTRGSIMFCARCGQALRDGVNFCEKCGAKVREYTPESAANTEKERLCGDCGCDVTGNSKTCQWCGADLK